MKLIIVGCSSGMPSPNLSHSCYLVESSGRFYMFDCGDGASSALLKCGTDTSVIENIFISHTHPDHVSGLPMFIQMEYLENRRKPLTVHIPSEFERVFNDLMRSFYLFTEKLNFEIVVKPIDYGYEFAEGIIEIEAHANSHLRGHREFLSSRGYDNRMQCFSFTVQAEGKKLVYSADIGSLDDLKNIALNADVLLAEGMHLDLNQLPAMLIEKNVQRCILTHLPDDFNRVAVQQSFSKAGYENLRLAFEGQIVDV
jgi:ribonuclease BN (tRNA processing enzyme)